MSASGSKTLSYDPLGRLYQVTTPSATTRFVYDGDRLIAEYSGSGTLLRRYVHGAGVDEPLVWYEGAAVSAANRRYLHANHQGSIVATSNASGAKLQIHAYDPYGVTAASNTARFQYTGQAAIPELGLLYYKARFYNPGLGRFMQTDPIGYEDDNNLYAYVGNDPLNRIDPTGTCNTGSRIDGINVPECKTYGEAVDTASKEDKPKNKPQREESAPQGEQDAPQNQQQSSSLELLPEFLADSVVGFGDGTYQAITLGMGDLDDVRWLFGLDYDPSDEIVYDGAQTIGKIEGGVALGGSSFVRGGWLNSNRYLRIGVGKHEGYKWFRIGGEWVRTESKHIDLFRIGSWP